MVAIKGMEMPVTCAGCDIVLRCYVKQEYAPKAKPSWCPLIETEDYASAKHGHWVGIDDFPHETWECDRCGNIIEGDRKNYCDNCGAKMDGGEK